MKRWRLLLVLVAALLGACGSQRPSVNVIGMSDMTTRGTNTRLTLLVEVHNPTQHTIVLSAFVYDFTAGDLVHARGRVELKRQVLPGSSTVVEVPVPVENSAAIMEWSRRSGDRTVQYRLEGNLIAEDGEFDLTWPVNAVGELVPTTGDDQGGRNAGGSINVVRAFVPVSASSAQ